VSVNSVKRAQEILRGEGLVRTVIGRGVFVVRPERS
jgi:DNA-binding transcriptional regulator YhcF (GntR family)